MVTFAVDTYSIRHMLCYKIEPIWAASHWSLAISIQFVSATLLLICIKVFLHFIQIAN